MNDQDDKRDESSDMEKDPGAIFRKVKVSRFFMRWEHSSGKRVGDSLREIARRFRKIFGFTKMNQTDQLKQTN